MRILCLSSFVLLCLCGCGLSCARTVTFTIPEHPWEEAAGGKLWYELRVIGPDSTACFHLGQERRSFTVEVPLGEALVVLAYPQGTGLPFGAFVDSETQGEVVLSQSDGILCSALEMLDWRCLRNLDYRRLREYVLSVAADQRSLDTLALASAVAHGRAGPGAVSLRGDVQVEIGQIVQGAWVCEYPAQQSLLSDGLEELSLTLPPHSIRFLNAGAGLVLNIGFSASGDAAVSVLPFSF
ncbi:MAG: hypothetical protein J5785_05450 [Spirochaetales bacterium]|nr:hypothetical protein [Spirochaetales bacterium]